LTVGQITAICLSPVTTGGKRNDKSASSSSRLLAVAEKGVANTSSSSGSSSGSGSTTASVSLFDLSTGKRRGRPLICPDMASRVIVSMCFSADGKTLLVQGGAPDWILVHWNWEKARVLQSAKVSNNTSKT
jgi:hypothetical protein